MSSVVRFAPAVDEATRFRVLDPSRSFIVQAPAGSGKTELLMQRFLRLLALPSTTEPESILAITFTNKAAAEMRLRILRALEIATTGSGEALPPHKRATHELAEAVLRRDRELNWRLIETPSRLRIQTIDAFCYQLAQRSPIGSGVSGSATIVERPKPLYLEAARRTVQALADAGQTGDAIALLLRRLDNNVDQLQNLLCGMLERREQWLRILGTSHGEDDLHQARARLQDSLRVVVEQELARVRNVLLACLSRNEREELIGYMDHAARHIENDPSIELLLGLSDLPGASAGDREHWLAVREFLIKSDGDLRRSVNKSNGFPTSDRTTRDNCVAWLQTLAESEDARTVRAAFARLGKVPPLTYNDEDWSCLRALFRVLPVAAAHLKTIFAEENAVDFAEVAEAARTALGSGDDASDLALLLGERIQHVLVDEFQDTSVAQMDLLRRLTAAWEPQNSVFVVGDPKQSIYGFREAEVGLFTTACQRGEVAGIESDLAELSANFRSQGALVDWFNDIFPELLTGEVKYPDEPVVAAREALRGQAVTLRGYVGFDPEQEAADVADAVESALAAGSEDVCILLRARTHAAHLVPALRERGIRFRGVELEKLTDRPVVRDLDALTRALLHPCDRLAWLAVLRAPWCGLSLEDLWNVCEGDKHTAVSELLRSRSTRLTASGRETLSRVLPVLETAVERRERVALRLLVEGTWLALGGPAAVRFGDEGAADLRDARAYLELLSIHEDAAAHDRVRFEERLDELYSPPDNSDGIRVHLMTMHKAKGLEFDTVIVPCLGRKTRGDDEALLHWREHTVDGEPHLLMAPVAAVGTSSNGASIADYIRLLRRDSEFEEDKRLLYVAATRAKKRLFLFGHVEDTPERRPNRNSLLGLLMQSPTFAERFQRTLPPPVAADPQGTLSLQSPRVPARLRRLPSGWMQPAAPQPLAWAVSCKPRDIGEVEHTFEWVDNLRVTGTVAHALLEQIAHDGLGKWSDSTVGSRRPAIRAALLAGGVPLARIDRELERVVRALRNTLEDPSGRWILQAHPGAASEFELSIPGPDGIRRVKVDRTFVHDGVRWIVDFKLTDGTDLKVQVEKYRPDLERYAEAIRAYDPTPVQTALYFPLQKKLIAVTAELLPK